MFVLSSCARQDSPQAGLESLATWQTLGTEVGPNYPSISSLAFSQNGNPVVVLGTEQPTRPSFGYQDTYVYQWVNGQWQVLGGILDIRQENAAENADIAIDRLNRPVVAWGEGRSLTGRHNIFVKRWSGQSWQRLGGRLTLLAGNQVPSLAIDSQNRPVIAFSEYHGDHYRLFVKRWENSSWVQLGDALDINNAIQYSSHSPSLAIDSNDRIVVAWRERVASPPGSSNISFNIYVKRWSGSSWVKLGGVLDVDQLSDVSPPSLALSSTAQPYVTWRENNNTSHNIYVKRWDGNGTWTLLGGPVGRNGFPQLATSGVDTVIVSFKDSANTYVKRWNGVDKWIGVGPQPMVAITPTALGISPTGIPTLAYFRADSIVRGAAYVQQYK